MKFRYLAAVCVIGLLITVGSKAADWIAAPSYYTHGQDGKRIQQYAPIGPFYYPYQDFMRSGYRQSRSSLQMGGTADHYHIVEEWGRPIRPYDEWRFPFRPYSAPYDAWGPPYAGLGYPYAYGRYPFFGGPVPPFAPAPPGPGIPGGGIPGPGFPGGGIPGPGVPGVGNPAGQNWGPMMPYQGYQPWFDDRYPAFDDRAPFRREPWPVLPP